MGADSKDVHGEMNASHQGYISEYAVWTMASRGKVTPALKQAAKLGSSSPPGKPCDSYLKGW